MSKEEIIKNSYPFYDPNQHKDVELCGEQIEQLMDAYAEKVAVAFAEWKDNNVMSYESNYRFYFWNSEKYIISETISDLYQYFITNVYNK